MPTHPTPKTNNPISARRLLGREAASRAATASWAAGAPLLHLHGPPGVGKSALAMHVAPADATVLDDPGDELLAEALSGALGRCILVTRRVLELPPGACSLEVRALPVGGGDGGPSLSASLLLDVAKRHGATLGAPEAEALAWWADGLPFALVELGHRAAIAGPGPLLCRLKAGAVDPLTLAKTRALLEPSLARISPELRGALMALAVFEESFSLAEGLEVLAAPSAAIGMTWVERLRSEALLCAASAPDGGQRLRLLRPLRGALAPPQDAQRRRTLQLSAEAGRQLARSRGREAAATRAWAAGALRELEQRLERALHSSDDPDLVDASANLFEALAELAPGWLPSAAAVAEHLARLSEARAETATRARLALGSRALLAGRLDSSERLYSEALDKAPSPELRGRARTGLAATLAHRGQTEAACAGYDLAIEELSEPASLRWRGQARAWKGLGLIDAGHPERGAAEVRGALRELDKAGDVVGVAVHLSNLGLSYARRGDYEAARALLNRALAQAQDSGDLRFQAAILSNLGGVDQDLGRFTEAAATYRRVHRAMENVIDVRVRYALAHGRGVALQATGEFEPARRSYLQARRLAWRLNDREREAECEAFLGALDAELGLIEEASARLASARALAASPPPSLGAAFELIEAILALGSWRAQLGDGELGAARATLKAAQGRRRAIQIPAGRPVLARRASALLGLACARVEAALADLGAAPSAPPPPLGGLVVEAGALGLWLPCGEYVDLRASRLKRRLLLTLAEAHGAQRGVPLSVDAMWRAGWGDERAQDAARRNRVYVAVASMRALGLHAALLSEPGGYLLDPDLEVRLRAPSPVAARAGPPESP